MIALPAREGSIMPVWSNSTVLHLIDSIAIAITQGYMLARARLTSHPSPVLRAKALVSKNSIPLQVP